MHSAYIMWKKEHAVAEVHRHTHTHTHTHRWREKLSYIVCELHVLAFVRVAI